MVIWAGEAEKRTLPAFFASSAARMPPSRRSNRGRCRRPFHELPEVEMVGLHAA